MHTLVVPLSPVGSLSSYLKLFHRRHINVCYILHTHYTSMYTSHQVTVCFLPAAKYETGELRLRWLA